MRQKVDFVSYVQPLSHALLPVFRAGSRLENQRDFVASTNRNNRVVLLGTFDVVIGECFGRRTGSAAKSCWPISPALMLAVAPTPTAVDEAFQCPCRSRPEARAACIQQDLAVTHNHFALNAVLAHKGHMTGNLLVDVVITQLATD